MWATLELYLPSNKKLSSLMILSGFALALLDWLFGVEHPHLVTAGLAFTERLYDAVCLPARHILHLMGCKDGVETEEALETLHESETRAIGCGA